MVKRTNGYLEVLRGQLVGTHFRGRDFDKNRGMNGRLRKDGRDEYAHQKDSVAEDSSESVERYVVVSQQVGLAHS